MNAGKTPLAKVPRTNITADEVFQALSDATRRAIIDRLALGPASVSQLAAPFDITLTAVGQHLQVLEQSGLVHTEKTGRVRTCRLESTGFDVLEDWVRDHRSAWEQRLDQLGEFLDEDAEPEEG